ncbi:TAP-like protein-domain-containing protein [Massariosphaeria phaeospora]|uniref:TAP-like protein-domain-containing protein n=1 Tax=Massariosphaeria phaeospora TaxID=100035 RepID=A0A7C8MKM8_9PLEO|nr:TAP-like protein-domain-containing protein [Massariosphaeria phaeospora]
MQDIMKSWSGLENQEACRSPQARDSKARFVVAPLVTLLIVVGLLEAYFPSLISSVLPWTGYPQSEISANLSDPFDWSSIEATKYFEFHSCFGNFKCAKLELPFDQFNGTYPDSTISLAIVKLPAKVPVEDPRYGGPILSNPGGPGGPGVLFALLAAEGLQTIVDSQTEPKLTADGVGKEPLDGRYYDIIGFDPRGIGWTAPRVTCLPDSPSAWSWDLRENAEGIVGSSDAALGRLWSMVHAYGASCKQAMDTRAGPDIKQYMTTAAVARDMLDIIERHADYVNDQLDDGTAHVADPPKLQYWGFSYGTYIGATFASMYPDRVGRVILDAVVNSDDYSAALGKGSLHDNEKVMNSFYTFCVLSGPEACPLATANSTAEDIEDRVRHIVQSLYHNPLAISSAQGPEVLTYSDVKMLIFAALYQPTESFHLLAELLAEIESGGGLYIDNVLLAARFRHIYSCPVNGSESHGYEGLNMLALFAVLCSDSEDLTSMSIGEFEDYWHVLEGIAPTSGSIWSLLTLKCASWKVKAVHKFKGAFGGNTSHPILWLSNTVDPVTPLRSARIMSARFPGSVVLVQDIAGHCSLAAPTSCVLRYVNDYFQTGALPDPDTLCIPPTSPFSLNSTDPKSPFYDPSLGKKLPVHNLALRDEHEVKLMHAARRLQRVSASFGMLRQVPGNERVERMLVNAHREIEY